MRKRYGNSRTTGIDSLLGGELNVATYFGTCTRAKWSAEHRGEITYVQLTGVKTISTRKRLGGRNAKSVSWCSI